ncbi:MAG: PAS domain S-box protein, partial [Myxococcota bacterium]
MSDESATNLERERTRQTLEQTIDAVVIIDGNNEITFFNAAAERLWGYSRNEVMGRNVSMLVPETLRDQHDELVNANRRTHIDKIVGTSREVESWRADGERRWGSLSLSRVEVAGETTYTAFVRDVTGEVERREQFQTLSLVANKTDNSVVITDADGRIEYVNPGFTKVTGYTLQEVIGKKPGSVLQGPATNRQTIERIREHLSRRQPFYEEILNYDKQGRQYWISLAVNPVFDDHGVLKKFVAIQA